jgi:uncharacterized protein YeaO (DUF488 family)
VARNIRLKRIYEAPSEDDGYRVLTTRYWPRGVPKGSIDEYLPVLAPSAELLHSYRQGQLDWDRFRLQYLLEMAREGPKSVVHRLAKVARGEVITLMCVCADEDHCHRSILRELVAGFDEA